MTQFDFFPSDARIAEALGMSAQWEAAQSYAWLFGYPFWCALAAAFFVLEMLVPAVKTSWIMFAAILTGIVVKLGEVYGWGRFSFGEQTAMFLMAACALLALRLLAAVHRPTAHGRTGEAEEA